MMPPRTDTVSPEKRSEIMRAVKGQGNKDTELVLARLLRQNEIIGWRRHHKLFGSPDFIFQREKRCDVRGWLFLAWLPEALSDAKR